MSTTRTFRLLRVPLVAAVVGWVAGCDTSQRQQADESPSSTVSTESPHPTPDHLPPATLAQAPKPDLGRLAYDPSLRKLTLYDLPAPSARWMIVVPPSTAAVPVVEGEYEFPAMMNFDPGQVTVFYTMPNRRPSPSVTLREIADAASARVQR
jgi:hypothetical protein